MNEMGELIFQYKSPDNQEAELLKIVANNNIAKNNLNVIFENVKYSDDEIKAAEDSLINSDLYSQRKIIGIYVDYTLNGLRVEFDKNKILSSEVSNEMYEITHGFTNILVSGVDGDYAISRQVSIAGGNKIKIGGGYCSVGYAAKDSSGNSGFVTAGHCGSVGNSVTYNGTTIGQITKQRYSTALDVAFVKTNSSTTVQKKGDAVTSPYASLSYTYVSLTLPVQGSYIMTYGYNTTQQTSIISNSASIGFLNKALTYRSSTINGDSGSLIMSGSYAYGVHNGIISNGSTVLGYGSSSKEIFTQ